jgi:hypothetical protein
MAIQDDISNFFDSMLQSAQSSTNKTRQATNVLAELDPMTRASLEMHYQPQQFGSLEEAMLFDPLLVDRVMKAYEQQASGLLDGGDYPDATMPDTSGAVPRPRPVAPRRTFPQTIPTQSLSDAELMQFESVPYARANEIQTLIDQAAVMQGRTRQDEAGVPGTAVSTAGLADDEMIAGFNPAQREAYARMVRDMAGTSGAANMRPDGAEPRSALVNSQLQAVIDRERGANRGRIGSQMTSEDEKAAVNFGLLAAPGAAGVVRGAQAAQRLGGLRALLNRIGIGNLAKARQATKGRFMRDPVTGRMIGAKDIGPQPPTQLQRMMLQAESGGVPKGAYADGGRLRDGIVNVYDRM